MKNTKLKIAAAILAACISVLAVGCTSAHNDTSSKAENTTAQSATEKATQAVTETATQSTTESATKFVGSKQTEGMSLDKIIYENLQSAVDDSVVIVTASYNSQPELNISKDTIDNSDVYCTIYNMQIDSVIKGDLQGDSFLYKQFGKPDDDEYETKIDMSQKYVMFLLKVDFPDGRTIYDAVGMEQGIFKILPDNTVMCNSDEGFLPSYDGTLADTFINDIKNCL